jgi:hypothetical protein
VALSLSISMLAWSRAKLTTSNHCEQQYYSQFRDDAKATKAADSTIRMAWLYVINHFNQ